MAEGGQKIKGYSETLTSQDFNRWLKTKIALPITGNGLKEYVTETLNTFHKELLQKVFPDEQKQTRGYCNKCTLDTIRPSSSCVCYKLKSEIIKHHNHFRFLFNTDPTFWCTSAWEVAKCYLPKMCTNNSSIEDLDFHGIISLMLNLDAFGDNHEVFDRARVLSNDVRHSSQLSCTEQNMDKVFHSMLEVLNCAEGTRVDTTKDELHKLKADKDFGISRGEFTKSLKERQGTETMFNEILKALMELQTDKDQTHVLRQYLPSVIEETIKHSDRNVGVGSDERRKQLKEYLLVLNKECYSHIQLQPVFEVDDAHLLAYYVEQRMSRVNRGQVLNPASQQKISLQNILDKEPGRDIYLVSKAGGGKTVFCKWLAMLWYQAHGPSETEHEHIAESERYIEAMKKYSFFFLITLRHCKDSNVDAMIQHQILDKLSHSASYTITDLQAVLHEENCLIILDGLDEWTHPVLQQCRENAIPERNLRRGCTFITTSRPWRFHMLNKLSSKTICVELQGFDENASKKFITNTLSNLGTQNPETRVEDVQKAITSQRLDRFKISPLTLSFLVCLWNENTKNIGQTMTEIYCNLIGLFLSGAEDKSILDESSCPPCKKQKIAVPKLVESNQFCAKYYRLLLTYGALAFATFFDDQRENAPAFDIACANQIIENEKVELGLKLGFLTEERQSTLIGKTRKLSFVHKTFQEFFAALYISSLDNKAGLLKSCFVKISNACRSLNNVLTVSHFYIFLFGICPKTAYELSKEFGKTVREDGYIYNFRRDMGSWSSPECYNKTAKDLQDLVVFSVEESRLINLDYNVNVPIILEDIIIDEDFTSSANYQKTLKSLVCANRKNIKSIKIRGIKEIKGFKSIVESLGGEELNPLVKIDCKCMFGPDDMDLLLHASTETLECFVIKGGEWVNDKWVHTHLSVPEHTCKLIERLRNIKELYLRNLTMSHVDLEALMQYLKEREGMKQLGLTYIKCKEHSACLSLDLSRSDQLSVLELGTLPLLNVKLNTHSLQTYYIGDFENHDAFATIMETLISASNLTCFRCGFLTEESTINVLLESIPKLININIIWLINVDLTRSSIKLSRKMRRL